VTAVVTGASRGIGRATALELARRGVPLALLGRPSAALDDTAAAARSSGVRVETISCDLEHPEQIASAGRVLLDRHGAPEVLVNNAAVIRRATVEHLTLAEWDEQLAVNLRAPFLTTRAFLPAMREAGRGRIIQVSSISATLGTPRAAAYCASKWGLVGFMKSLAEELSGSGLMTVGILPGSVDTEMLRGSGFEPRMTADHVARTIAYYALEAPLAHNGGVVEMFGV
jgi:NAD(P)-dependent dehydrogenase (short-subunit alcohol dehydrogenase family)